MKALGFVLAAVVTGECCAGDGIQWMPANELTATFAGRTLSGYYPNGVTFEETYKTGGTIAYHDSYIATTGNWLIAGTEFCTFYKDVLGGCFRGYRVSENCFRFYLSSEVKDRLPADVPVQSYEVTGWLLDAPNTCPPPPTV